MEFPSRDFNLCVKTRVFVCENKGRGKKKRRVAAGKVPACVPARARGISIIDLSSFFVRLAPGELYSLLVAYYLDNRLSIDVSRFYNAVSRVIKKKKREEEEEKEGKWIREDHV